MWGRLSNQLARYTELTITNLRKKVKAMGSWQSSSKTREGWEYLVEMVPHDSEEVRIWGAQRRLNELGEDGWELVSVQGTGFYQGWMYLKRRK